MSWPNMNAWRINVPSGPLGLPGQYENEKDQEIIGVKDAVLFWISNYGTGTNSAAGGGFTATTFDVTSYSNGAIVKLNNDSGGDRKMKAACIYGKPVVRYSGEKALVHDEFVDYDSIVRDGEKKLEFSNNYIVTKAQLEQLADHYWKANNYKRHTYELEIPGRCYWFCPGEWYTLTIGSAGKPEYIDSVCECYDVQIEAEAGGLGRSVVAFREVYQNWTKDSGALARFLGSGSPKDKYNFSRVLVASQYYPGPSDFRCDGTADQTEIQAAIDQVAGFGGGVVELTEGTFNTTAAIDLSYDNVVLTGAGIKTVVTKNCNDYAVKCNGAAGDLIVGVQLSNLKVTRSTADTNAKALIYFTYTDGALIENVEVYNSYSTGITLTANTTLAILSCIVSYSKSFGIMETGATGTGSIFQSNIIHHNGDIFTGVDKGIQITADNALLNSNVLYANAAGIISGGENVTISNNSVCDNYNIPNEVGGITVGSGSDHVSVIGNMSRDNGNLIVDGDGGSTAGPYLYGDARSLSGCTVSRSTVEYYFASYSNKITQTDASTGEYRFCDNVTKNDLHGLYPGTQYKLSAYTYLLATGSPTTAEVKLIVGYTTDAAGAWHETSGNVTTDHDAWGLAATTNVAIPSGAVGAKALVRIKAAASTDEYIFIDNVRLQPIGTHNLHSQNFYDAGSNTYIGV